MFFVFLKEKSDEGSGRNRFTYTLSVSLALKYTPRAAHLRGFTCVVCFDLN